MASIIKIRRTLGSSVPDLAPSGEGTAQGELIYVYDSSNVGSGKTYKKLYIGHPDGTGDAPIPIGGEYYTDLLPANTALHGTLIANQAIVVDANKKIDELRADNIQIAVSGANEIDTESGNLTLDSAGGIVIIDDQATINDGLRVEGDQTYLNTALQVSGISTFNGEVMFNTGMIPDTDKGAYIGTSGRAFANAYINDVTIGAANTTVITTRAGELFLTAYENLVVVDDDLTVTGLTSFASGATMSGVATITGQLEVDDIIINDNVIATKNTTGILYLDPHPGALSADGIVVIKGDLQVDGSTISENATTVTVNDPVIRLGDTNTEKTVKNEVSSGTTSITFDNVVGVNTDDVVAAAGIVTNTTVYSVNTSTNVVLLNVATDALIAAGSTVTFSQGRADTADRGIEFEYISSGTGTTAVTSRGYFGALTDESGGTISTTALWAYIPNAEVTGNSFSGVRGFLDIAGIYYQADGENPYDGPNGVAYFDSTGLVKSGVATDSGISTSNYVLTTGTDGIPIWTDTLDAGTF